MWGWPSGGHPKLLLPGGPAGESDSEEQLPLGDQTGNFMDNGRWDGAGMSGGDTQRRDAAAGAGRTAVNTYRD